MPETNESMEERRIRHIEEMKEKLQCHFKEHGDFNLDDSMSLEMQEKFLEQLVFLEGCDEQSLFNYLEKGGIRLPRPEDLDDEQLHSKLWEVINAMALVGHFLSSTDHLSDRQLYEHLWNDILREPTSISPENNAFCHIDILGGCSEEDLRIRLQYYADEMDRIDWEEQFPDYEMPPKKPCPYDRDQHLPVPSHDTFQSLDIC